VSGKAVPRTRPSAGWRLLALVLAGCVLGQPGLAGSSPSQAPEPDLSPRQLRDNLAAKTYSGRHIDLVFSKAGLQEVIGALEKAGGIPLKLDPSIDDPVTYRMLDVAWDEALAAVIADNGLHISLDLEEKGFKIGRGNYVVLAFPERGRAKVVLFLYRNLAAIALGIVLLVGLPIVVRAVRRRRGHRDRNGKRALLPPEAVERVKAKLAQVLKEERIYRDEKLTLRTLAGAVGVSPHQLSWIINEELRVSFPTLINGYRIEEVKSRLADPSFDGASILRTAMEAGFNTKASFNRAFKRQTGMTPSEYRKSLSS
jgi:AraC-like DNA-binding protein